jgi:hypothetical protein
LSRHAPQDAGKKAPLEWTGVLFALATNLLLVTLVDALGAQFGLRSVHFVLSGIVAPTIAGILTALYTRQRGGMHAFLGGLLSLPILGLFVLPGLWQLAIFAAAFCTLGGAITEIIMRRR